ncbi:MAG: L,D-transpeptidase family protein [Myxococcota bacterium]
MNVHSKRCLFRLAVLGVTLLAAGCGESATDSQPTPQTAQEAVKPPPPPEPPPVTRDELVRQTVSFLKGWDTRKATFIEAYRTDFERALSRMSWFKVLSTRAYEARGFTSLIFSDGQNLRPAAHELIAAIEDVDAHGLNPEPYRRDGLKELLQKVADKQQDYSKAIVAPEEELPAKMWAVLERLHSTLDANEMAIDLAMEEAQFDDSHIPLLDDARTRLDRLFQAKASLNDVLRDLDLGLLSRWFRYAYDMRFSMRLHPFDADKNDGAGVERVAEDLFALFSSTDFDAMAAALTALEPQHPEYRKLMAELARYRQLAAEGTSIVLPNAAKKLKLGSKGETVELLEKRLIQESYLEGEPTGEYDERLQAAVLAYQATHQFKQTGLMDRKARSSMNIPMSRRAEQLARGLQRHRESELHQGKWRFGAVPLQVRINIPQFEATFFKDGKAARTHRVVVGSNAVSVAEDTGYKGHFNRTRLFSRQMRTVVLNPTWRVPPRIKEQELDPKLMEDPDFYEANNYDVVIHDDGSEHVIQLAGPNNALGEVKFLFPNEWSIYMHDTPKKRLFKRELRAFSHGCMRVHEALDLARWILVDNEGWTNERFDKVLKKRQTYGIPLKNKIAITIDYNPVAVHENGRAMFLSDVYKYDRDQAAGKTPYVQPKKGRQTQVVLVD